MKKARVGSALLVVSLVAASAAALKARSTPAAGDRWWSYVEALAKDGMQGRITGSQAYTKAAKYVASEFQKAGLKPAGVGGFLQPIKFHTWKNVEAGSSVTLTRNGKAEPLVLGEDVNLGRAVKGAAAAVEAPLFFVGNALTVPEMNFDDFAGLDVRGKVIVFIGGGPSNIPGTLKSHYQNALERRRFLRKAGVLGTATIQNPRTSDIPWSRSTLARLQENMILADPDLSDSGGLQMSLTINAAHADKWLDGSGHTIDELLDLVAAGKPLPHFPLVPTVRAVTNIEEREVESQNVVAVRPGTDPALKGEYVVLSAHLDHLGVSEPINGDKIYNGAMDNASGIASLLDIAKTLQETNTDTRRSLLFVAVTGEEKGELGSRYFATHPTVDGKKLVADINVDMYLPLYPLKSLTVYGLNESDLGDAARRTAMSLNIAIQDDRAPQRNIFIRSDQYSFIRAGVPSLMMAFGNEKGSKEEQIEQEWLKNRYHAPSDDLAQPVDRQAAADFDRFIMQLARTVADDATPPQWKQHSFFKRFAKRG
jgi:hypothetical protein